MESEPPMPRSKGGRVMTRFRRRKEEVKILNNAIQAIQRSESDHLTADILEPPKRGKEIFERELAKDVKAYMMERVRFFLDNCPSEKLDPDAALGRLHPAGEEVVGRDAADERPLCRSEATW